MNDKQLTMWTVYDHPEDFPDAFIAREWLVTSSGAVASGTVIKSRSLARIRHELASYGLTCLTRSPEDDPVIVETWI